MAEAAPSRGGSGWVAWLLVLGLLGAVLWLSSERNARKWFLSVESGQLVVARGRNFPTGTRTISATDAELGKAYAPIPIPPGVKAVEGEFDDRAALDHALFEQLLPWAKAAADKPDATSQAAAMALSERASSLPGLAASQLDQLSSLRGDLAYTAALAELSLAAGQIESARRLLQQAHERGGRHALDAGRLAGDLKPMADLLGDAAAGRAPAIVAPTLAPAPADPKKSAPGISPSSAPAVQAPDAARPDGGR